MNNIYRHTERGFEKLASVAIAIFGNFITCVIQKSFNRFSASLHLKVNELVASHQPASNAVMNAEGKTEQEITDLSKEYAALAEQVKEDEESTGKTMDSIRTEKQ